MEYSILVLKQSVIMFLIACIGIICYKTKIITKDAQKFFSTFVLKVVIPCFAFISFQVELSAELISGMLAALLLSVVSHILLILLSMIVIRKKEGTEYAIERFSLIYTNCGFMGIPLISGVFGQEGALYATIYLTVFNILVWTHGVMIMKNQFSLKELLVCLVVLVLSRQVELVRLRKLIERLLLKTLFLRRRVPSKRVVLLEVDIHTIKDLWK